MFLLLFYFLQWTTTASHCPTFQATCTRRCPRLCPLSCPSLPTVTPFLNPHPYWHKHHQHLHHPYLRSKHFRQHWSKHRNKHSFHHQRWSKFHNRRMLQRLRCWFRHRFNSQVFLRRRCLCQRWPTLPSTSPKPRLSRRQRWSRPRPSVGWCPFETHSTTSRRLRLRYFYSRWMR